MGELHLLQLPEFFFNLKACHVFWARKKTAAKTINITATFWKVIKKKIYFLKTNF